MGRLSDKIDKLAEEKDIEGLKDLRDDTVNGRVTGDDDKPAELNLELKLGGR